MHILSVQPPEPVGGNVDLPCWHIIEVCCGISYVVIKKYEYVGKARCSMNKDVLESSRGGECDCVLA